MAIPLSTQADPPWRSNNPIEPTAGTWQTWVIDSGASYRVAAPPTIPETRAELSALKALIQQNDAAARQQIKYWDAGSPGYRWIDLINARFAAGTLATPFPHRVWTYVAQAVYDATVATWDSKYYYKRFHPSQVDFFVPTALPVPNSPSYPSEHAAAGAAAATVLAYFFPAEAQAFQAMAEEQGLSRVRAGLQFPSDNTAGLALGRAVGAAVVAKAKLDGSDAVWTGTVPPGPCNWTGTNPGNVTQPDWPPILLTSANEFRPTTPPDCHSQQVQDEVATVKNFPRTFATNYKAFYWQSPDGLQIWPFRYADKWMFEDGLDRNAPRAARVYALIASVNFDAFIASNDGKFAYWYLRPHQLDTTITPLFPVPNFPSYPSNHSTLSTAKSEVIAYLFPDPARATFIRALGKEAGDSRIWAGIHYPMDNAAGVELGKNVANVFIDWAKHDGSP